MKIDGAIFDLDGTLLDSMCVWDNLDRRYLESIGIEPTEELENELRCASLRRAAELLRQRYELKFSEEEIMAGINKLVEDMYFYTVQPKEGVPEFLEHLRSEGVKMCVATATDRYQAEAALERCGLLSYFDGIFTCTEMGVGKEDTAIFRAALELLGTETSRTFVFEDALHAIESAKKLGLKVAAVKEKSAEREEGRIVAISDIYIESFKEAADFF